MKGAWSTSRKAALLNKAMRDSRAGLLSPHQAGFDGAASTRGGLGAECCAMRISRDELFGPAVAVTPFDTIEDAIALANDSIYGLAAGIFTENVEWAMKFAREAEAGNLHVNWGSQWRVDLMPYGGLKDSGFGKEGPKYAVQEMTELKMVVFHLNS